MSDTADGLAISAEDLQLESATRLAKSDTDAGTQQGGAGEHPGAAEGAAEAGGQQDTHTQAGGHPAVAGSSVLDAFPESLRDHIQYLPPEVQDELKKGYLRQDDYTRKRQEETGETSQLREAAEAWQRVIDNPHARNAVVRAFENPAPDAENEGEQFDYTAATHDEIQAQIRKEAKAIAAEIVQERVEAPVQRVEQIKAAARSFRQEVGSGVDDAAFRGAFDQTVTKYGAENITPENVKLLMEPFVEIAKLKAQLNGSPGGDQIARATSPPGYSSTAPVAKPLWKQQGREPNEQERVDATLRRVQKMTGARLSRKDIDDLLLEDL